MLSSWIWLTLSFGNFPICLILIWIVSCTFINCLCSCRWKALCLHKYSFYICCHPLASTSSTWKLFLCKRKQVKIVIISPYESKEAWDIWLFLKNRKGHINKTHWQSCLLFTAMPWLSSAPLLHLIFLSLSLKVEFNCSNKRNFSCESRKQLSVQGANS